MITEELQKTLNRIAELIKSDPNLQEIELGENTHLLIDALESHGFKNVDYQDFECSSTGEYASMTFTGAFEDKQLIIELSTNPHYEIYINFFDLKDILDNKPEIPLNHKLQVIMLRSLVEFL